MTKDRAKKLIIKAHWDIDDPIKELMNTVDEIYNSQEPTKSCGSCKWNKYSGRDLTYDGCNNNESFNNLTPVPDNHSCPQWETKDGN